MSLLNQRRADGGGYQLNVLGWTINRIQDSLRNGHPVKYTTYNLVTKTSNRNNQIILQQILLKAKSKDQKQ